MLIAQLSDSHVLAGGRRLAGRFDTGAAFARAIASLAAQPVRPDLVLVSGDLGEDATEEEYALVGAGLRSLGLPVLAVPGNHDARALMLAQLPDMVRATDGGHLCLCERRGALVFIGLDTLVEGAPHGTLCDARLAWLDARLAEHADCDVVIFMHHPPLITGMEDMDSMGLLTGREALADRVAAHGRVRAILCGHMHRAIQGSCGGAPVRVAPSASHQIAFDLRPGTSYAFSDEAPQYMMHLVGADGALTSHIVPV